MVTIATNMAGRGTDIKLTPETRDAGRVWRLSALKDTILVVLIGSSEDVQVVKAILVVHSSMFHGRQPDAPLRIGTYR